MRLYKLALLTVVFVVCGSLTSNAVEPYMKFVQGLRDRGYHDLVLLYLDQIEKQPGVPAEIRQVIDFERAVTLIQSARTKRNPETQTQELEQAKAFLEKFARENPKHPKAGQANTERARIMLGQARVSVWQSKSPANDSKKAELQNQARTLIKQARVIFQAAHDQHEKSWKVFPVHIDKRDEPEKYAAARTAEVNYIRAQLDLALCTYEEAQTHNTTAPEFKTILNKAANEFAEIHARYRSQVGGLYARMWQGKCFEEQDEIGKALGIYNELLEHQGSSAAMQKLQHQIRQFRLICLNNDKKKDYQLVVQESLAWTTKFKRLARTKIGQGIRWERARAYEKLGKDRTLSEKDRERYLRRGLGDARTVNKYPGQYKDVSQFMIQRLLIALDRDPGDPEDFDAAFGLSRNMVKEVANFNESIAKSKNKAEKTKLQNDLNLHLKETARILGLALALADEETEISQVNNARYYLSYVYYLLGNTYKAAILGEFVGKNYRTSDPQMALDSAYLAMAAYVKAYNATPKGKRDFEMDQMVRVCGLITEHWPASDRANDARMTLGRIYSQRKKPADAAAWYGQVPETASQYPAAQLAAGQSYWTAYLEAAPLPADKKPSVEELQKWQDASLKHLLTGIAKRANQVPQNGPDSSEKDELIAAEVSLAQIRINKGQYKEAIELFSGKSHPVVKAIAVSDESDRPAKGIKSREFAGLVYQLLLRSYVGTQQIDLALKAMESLESISSGSEADAVMGVYVQLGQELQKEIERLKGLNQTARLAEVRSSFDKFLNELFKRKDDMKYGALIWIAETYYGLGQGMGQENQSESKDYFEKAASTYTEILNRDKTDPEFIDASRESGVTLRLVNCKRRQGDFEEAVKLVTNILKTKPRALDAQFEAALTFQDWGASGQPESYKKFLLAINGNSNAKKQKGPIWGWGPIGIQLQRMLDIPGKKSRYQDQFFQARYNGSWCRQQYGLGQSSTAQREQALKVAQQEIESFALISVGLSDAWKTKFNTLFRDIQKGRNIPESAIADIDWPVDIKPQAPTRVAAIENKPAKKKAAQKKTVPPTPGPPMILILLAVVIAVGGAAGLVYVMMKSQKKAPRIAYAASAPIPGAAPARRPVKKKKVAGKQSGAAAAAKRKASAGKRPAVKKTAGPKAGGSKPSGNPKSTKPRPSNPQ